MRLQAPSISRHKGSRMKPTVRKNAASQPISLPPLLSLCITSTSSRSTLAGIYTDRRQTAYRRPRAHADAHLSPRPRHRSNPFVDARIHRVRRGCLHSQPSPRFCPAILPGTSSTLERSQDCLRSPANI